MDEHAEFDYLCIGEGESFVADFLAKLGKPGLLETPNLAFRRDGQSQANPCRMPEDLAQLPPFPWHLFPNHAVVQEGPQFLYVNATRGCPFACSYCCNAAYLGLYGKRYLRFRPVEHVIDELRLPAEDLLPRAVLLWRRDDPLRTRLCPGPLPGDPPRVERALRLHGASSA